MARAILPHEAVDPDFQWLLSNYAQRNPGAFLVDATCLPVTIILVSEDERAKMRPSAAPPSPLPATTPPDEQERDDPPTE